MTPADAANWMAAAVRRLEYLDHAQVIEHLMAADPELATYNASGNPAVARTVLNAFKALKHDDIIWSLSGQHWRLREPGDPPGRSAP